MATHMLSDLYLALLNTDWKSKVDIITLTFPPLDCDQHFDLSLIAYTTGARRAHIWKTG